MKKFLVGIVIIIIASIGFNLKPDKSRSSCCGSRRACS